MGAATLRPADPDDPADAAAAAELWLASRRANVGSIPPPVHTDAQVRTWMRDVVLPTREVWLAVAGEVPLRAVGLLVLDDTWLDDLYVAPGRTGDGIGGALLDLAKQRRPDGFGLWVFETNKAAQRFYERHGLVAVARTDGSDNDERAPDVHYAWRPADATDRRVQDQ